MTSMSSAPGGDAADQPPGRRGYRLPAPTDPVERVVIAWPTMKRVDFWRNHLGAARDAFAIVARTLAEYTDLVVVTDLGEARSAAGWIGGDVEVVELAIDDSWLRDNGPLTLCHDDGSRLALHCGFNGWGSRLVPFDADAAVAADIADHLGIAVQSAPFVLEGGAVAGNGAGTVVTTASCLLHPNRNGEVDRSTVESWLADWLGAEQVIWLPAGLADDWGTDGHVDNLVCFTDERTVLLQTTTDTGDPDWHTAAECRRLLADHDIEVVEIDVLPHVQCFDQLVEVPYLNHLVTTDAVFVPLAGAAADREMVERIGASYPGRSVVGVPGTVLAYGGGGLHSLACPIPAASPTAPS